MENTYLPCWEIPPVSGDPSRIGRSLACRDPLPLRGAGSLHARDLPLRSGSPSTVVISLHGRYVFFHTSLASLKYYPNIFLQMSRGVATAYFSHLFAMFCCCCFLKFRGSTRAVGNQSRGRLATVTFQNMIFTT